MHPKIFRCFHTGIIHIFHILINTYDHKEAHLQMSNGVVSIISIVLYTKPIFLI